MASLSQLRTIWCVCVCVCACMCVFVMHLFSSWVHFSFFNQYWKLVTPPTNVKVPLFSCILHNGKVLPNAYSWWCCAPYFLFSYLHTNREWRTRLVTLFLQCWRQQVSACVCMYVCVHVCLCAMSVLDCVVVCTRVCISCVCVCVCAHLFVCCLSIQWHFPTGA